MEKIGQILKCKREEQKLTIEDVNSSTRIPLKFIAALEEDNVAGFPAELYYYGSLRRYALFLGLNDAELVDAYKLEKASRIKLPVPAKQETRNTTMPSRFWPVFIFMVLCVSLLTFSFINSRLRELNKYAPVKQVHLQPIEKPQLQKKNIKELTKRQARAQAQEAAQVQAPKPKAAVPAEPVSGLKLEIEALDSSWVKVTADGNTVFSTTLEKGVTKVWSAENKFGLVVGYAPGVKVRLNGKTIDVKSAAKQDVSELTLTSQDVKK